MMDLCKVYLGNHDFKVRAKNSSSVFMLEMHSEKLRTSLEPNYKSHKIHIEDSEYF